MTDFKDNDLITNTLKIRPRRLRSTPFMRRLIRENQLLVSDFIYPLFINQNITHPTAINSMPGIMQLPLNALPDEIESLTKLGISAILLFGIPDYKDEQASASIKEHGIIQQAIRTIREINSDIIIIADVCLCEYTSHGHCGIINNNNNIDNDKTLEILKLQAISMAKAGVNMVAPSGMMDGMVGAIREALDNEHFTDVAILSYAVKYHSNFYGPFREAALGAPKFGSRKSHQMDIANSFEALREAALDINEGADILMVKPAMNYLDIIQRINFKYPEIPLCAYQVSGEYSMLKAGAANGYFDEKEAFMESLIAIKRAGAKLIVSYYAKDAAKILNATDFKS